MNALKGDKKTLAKMENLYIVKNVKSIYVCMLTIIPAVKYRRRLFNGMIPFKGISN